MTFKEVLAQVVDWLQEDGRVSNRALKRHFEVGDDYLEDVREALLYSHAEHITDDGQGLIWSGEPRESFPDAKPDTNRETRFHATLLAVIALLQREGRVTYSTLKLACGLDDRLLGKLCEELRLRRLAIDEEGKVLAWAGAAQPTLTPSVAYPSTRTHGLTALPENSLSEITLDKAVVKSQPFSHVAEAERRQLTVMFCDLIGSTDLSGKLDPENLREVVKAYQETAAVVIARYEGHIAQYLGDGLLVYFGWPQAHENDAERAVYTGVEIPEAIAMLNTRLETDYGVQLAVRIGIHTGPVVVGEMGGGGRHENLALGETPNIAARLESLAQPNTAVISSDTAQLVQRSFVLKELGLHDLKGVSEPMSLYAVVGSREAAYDDHEGMLAGGFDGLVGRDEEIGLLLRRWQQSKDGQGQVVLISGEAGLGKSSLVEGLRAQVRQVGGTHLAFRCSPYTVNSTLYPVISSLQRVLGWKREDGPESRLAKLEQALTGYRLPHQESLPLLAALLSLPLPEGRYPPLTLTPSQQHQQTHDTLVAWMLEESERQPLLVVWEDLHWADPSTLELLGLFVEQTPTVPMMNVLAFRPEFIPPWPRQSHMTPITLSRLEHSHMEVFVRRLAGGKQLPHEVETHIVTKTDGVPLYVEELTKMLLESDLLEEHGEQYVLTGSLSSASIPATLQDSLMARLDRLPGVKEVAQLGSVLGREFTYDVIQALAGLDESTLQKGLSQLVSNELLYQRGRIPRATFIFRHVLIRDAAYQSLLRRTRQQVHKQVAQLLESRFPEVVETQPELVAYHYTEAGLAEPAIGYCQRAGERAIQRTAYQEAISHLTTGLTLLQTLPETLDRHKQELPLQSALGTVLRIPKGFAAPEVADAFMRARVLCQELGDTQHAAPVLYGLWRLYTFQADFPLARQIGEELFSLAERRDDSSLYILAHYSIGVACLWTGELHLAQTHLEGSLERYTLSQWNTPMFLAGQSLPRISCRAHAAITLWLLGYPDQALTRVHDVLALAIELIRPFGNAVALSIASMVCQLRGEGQDVYDHAEAAVSISTEQGFPVWLTFCTILRGWALVANGKREEGLTQMRDGLADYRASGSEFNVTYFLSLIAEVSGTLNQVEEGFGALREGDEVMECTGESWYEAEMHRLKGQLLLKQSSGHATEAEYCFQQAITIAQCQSAKSWELRAATSLAKLWQSQGKRDEAHELLSPIFNWFTEGFETSDFKEAQLLLSELAEGC